MNRLLMIIKSKTFRCFAVALSTIVCAAYAFVFYVAVLFDYDNPAGYTDRDRHLSGLAAAISGFMIPSNSKLYIEIYKNDLSVRYAGSMFIDKEHGADDLIREVLEFSRLHERNLNEMVVHDLYLHTAKILNAYYFGAGRGIALYAQEAIEKSSPANKILLLKLKDEALFADLVGFYASLSSKDRKLNRLNDFVESEIRGEHRGVLDAICSTEILECKFSEIRWAIGLCIRANNLRKSLPGISCDHGEINRKLTSYCRDTSRTDCKILAERIYPYVVWHLISLGGS